MTLRSGASLVTPYSNELAIVIRELSAYDQPKVKAPTCSTFDRCRVSFSVE